jgi:hypothetical protein
MESSPGRPFVGALLLSWAGIAGDLTDSCRSAVEKSNSAIDGN